MSAKVSDNGFLWDPISNRRPPAAPAPSNDDKKVRQLVDHARVASVVVAVASVVFAAVFFNMFTAVLAGLITHVSRDVHRVTSNGLKMLDDPEARNMDRTLAFVRLTEGAPMLRFAWMSFRNLPFFKR